MIVDTHQHLWDLSRFRLPWMDGQPQTLRRNYTPEDYAQAASGLGELRAVYMEVDVDPPQQAEEAAHAAALCESGQFSTVAAVVGGRPADDGFDAYISRLSRQPCILGVRQVLHVPSTPPGYCLQEAFLRGVRRLGDLGLLMDVCIRPRELADAAELARRCSGTTFIIDHCGNADPRAFARAGGDEQPWHAADAWRRDMAALAELDNTVCKISGIVVRTRAAGWSSGDLAPIVDFCLDAFGGDRVVVGSDWPVCRLRAELAEWVAALREIVSARPEQDQRKLWSENAQRIYRLK